MTTLVPEEFAPLERQSTAELIAERLRIAIMRGVLAPGAQLGEASLAAQFAVSRGRCAKPCSAWCPRVCCAVSAIAEFSSLN